MALIPCPECNKKISDKSVNCVNCGYPINISTDLKNDFINNKEFKQPTCLRPELDDDLSVGDQGWFPERPAKGVFEGFISSDERITSSSGKISLYKKGVVLSTQGNDLNIHLSQIIDMKVVPNSQVFEKDKSVVGRALLGGVLLGPIAAVIAGMSGIGTKKHSEHSIIINYWDVDADMPYSAMLYIDDLKLAQRLCNSVQQKIAQYRAQRKEKQHAEKASLEIFERTQAEFYNCISLAKERIESCPDDFIVIGGNYGSCVIDAFKDISESDFLLTLKFYNRKLTYKGLLNGVTGDQVFLYYVFDTIALYREGICLFFKRDFENIIQDQNLNIIKLVDISDLAGVCTPELFEELSQVCGTQPANQDEMDYLGRMVKAGLR